MEFSLGIMRHKRRIVSSPEEAMKILEKFQNVPREVVVVIHLKPDLSSETIQKVTLGTSEACCFESKDIYKEAFVQEASGIILAHSHPWQRRIRPSAEDIKLTKAVALVGRAAKMPLVDHIVFGRDGFYSFRAKGKVLRASPTYTIQRCSGGRIKGTKSVFLQMLAKTRTSFIIR